MAGTAFAGPASTEPVPNGEVRELIDASAGALAAALAQGDSATG